MSTPPGGPARRPETGEAPVGEPGRGPGDPEGLLRRIAAIADEKLADEMVALDVRELVSYTDFLLLCTARNERQAKAVHDEVYIRLKREHGVLPARVEGLAESRWVLMDYLDCVVHLFIPEVRDHYRLETLWGEAPRLELGLGDRGSGGVRRQS